MNDIKTFTKEFLAVVADGLLMVLTASIIVGLVAVCLLFTDAEIAALLN